MGNQPRDATVANLRQQELALQALAATLLLVCALLAANHLPVAAFISGCIATALAYRTGVSVSPA